MIRSRIKDAVVKNEVRNVDSMDILIVIRLVVSAVAPVLDMGAKVIVDSWITFQDPGAKLLTEIQPQLWTGVSESNGVSLSCSVRAHQLRDAMP